MAIADEISGRLASAFSPDRLEIIDESEQHLGHGGWRDGGETHFRVILRARALGPMTRVARHRAVHAALGADLVARIHALALDLA